MNRVEVGSRGVDLPGWADRLGAYAEAALRVLGRDNWDLSIVLCDDITMRELNARYRGKDETTDVLSFALGETLADEGDGPRFIAGDIVISLPTLGENAGYFAVSEDEELRRLTVHGILHLDGQDHESNESAEPMLVRQEEIVAALSGERILS